jgi:hypothetical protein
MKYYISNRHFRQAYGIKHNYMRTISKLHIQLLISGP